MTPQMTPSDAGDHAPMDDESFTARSQGLSTVRVAALTDGVFAIVLTLLVLDLHAPAAATQAQLLSSLREIVPQLTLFVVSFAIVGVFW
jgi:TMEM175 potassium channel family protein